jgi:hypothetical protein
MADTLRIKRRAAGGAAGAPASLAAAELAFNEQDLVLYYGRGNAGGLATSVIAIAGPGAFAPLNNPTFTGTVSASGGVSGSLVAAIGAVAPASPFAGRQWWNVNDGKLYIYTGSAWVEASSQALPVATPSMLGGVMPDGSTISVNPSGVVSVNFGAPGPIGSATPAAGGFTTLNASGAVSGAGFTSLLSPYAPLASPALSGTPTAPTATAGTNTTQIATTAFVAAAVTASVAGVSSFNTRTGAVTLLATDLTTPLASPPAVGGTTPNTGRFTTLQATGAITPSQTVGIVGTTTNNSAQAGSLGEVVSADLTSGSQISLTNNAAANVTSMSLTAGDWDVRGGVWFNISGSGTTALNAGINNASATMPGTPAAGSRSAMVLGSGYLAGGLMTAGPCRFSLASATTIYLLALAGFGSGTVQAYGHIEARRMR